MNRLNASDNGISRGFDVAVFYSGGHGDFIRIRIIDNIGFPHGRNAKIVKIFRAGIDDLMRFGSGGSADKIARLQRIFVVAEAVFALAGDYVAQFVKHVVAVKRKRLFARRNDMHRAAEFVQAKQPSNSAPFGHELVAVSDIDKRDISDAHDWLFG